VLIFNTLLLAGGCASEPADPDPFEPVNRVIFSFNDKLDQVALEPVAKAYNRVTPHVVRMGVENFFSNLNDLTSALNASLQWRLVDAGRNGGRFLVNSTIGLLGVIDIASQIGIKPYRTDFGVTLSTWGFPSGPYLVVPLFGPRTVRSGVGSLFDAAASVQWQLDGSTRNALWVANIIDHRAELLNAEVLMIGDHYVFLRSAYLQRRRFLITGSVGNDFSSTDEDWEEW
jgi:phospholipid-binding lipoprotein MlaA